MEATSSVIQAVTVAKGEECTRERSRPVNTGPRLRRHSLKQPSFDWNIKEKHAELRNFKLELNDILYKP